MITGAACASAWWNYGTSDITQVTEALAGASTVPVLIWLMWDTIEAFDA